MLDALRRSLDVLDVAERRLRRAQGCLRRPYFVRWPHLIISNGDESGQAEHAVAIMLSDPA